MKLSHAWLFLLLPLSGTVLAAPEPLLKVVVASPTLATNGSMNTCTLDGSGQVLIENTVKSSLSGVSLKSKEAKTVTLNANGIKSVIALAAQGKISGTPPVVGGFEHQYFAFQNAKKIFLLDKAGNNGLFNDSPAVKPLTDFIDSVCGDLSLVAYQDSGRGAFSKVILSTSAVKAAIDVCAQTQGGFGVPGTAGACDGTPSGDLGVFDALDVVAKQIAADPDTKTASVTINLLSATQVAITATAVIGGGLLGETYALIGTYNPRGFVIWTLDVTSTCLVSGIC